jgi:hypothetical protein
MVHRWQEEALNRNQHHNKLSECLQKNCPSCGKPIWNEYDNYRQVRKRGGSSTTTFKNPSLPKLVVRTLSNCMLSGLLLGGINTVA